MQSVLEKAIKDMEAFDTAFEDNHSLFQEKASAEVYCIAYNNYRSAVLDVLEHSFNGNQDVLSKLNTIDFVMDCSKVMEARRNYIELKRLYEEAKQKNMIERGVDIFISHCEKDKLIAKQLVEIFKSAIKGLDHDKIFCSSVDGFKIKSAGDIPAEIKRKLGNCNVFVLLLTKSSLRSSYTMFECGVIWFLGRPVFTLACGVDINKNLPSTLKNMSVKDGTKMEEFFQFVKDVTQELKLKLYDPDKYSGHISDFINMIGNKQKDKRK